MAVDDSPDGQFGADIVGRADEARFCEGSTEYHELAKTNRAGFFCDPSEGHHGLASVQSTTEHRRKRTRREWQRGAMRNCLERARGLSSIGRERF
jgi:hypothetical protein